MVHKFTIFVFFSLLLCSAEFGFISAGSAQELPDPPVVFSTTRFASGTSSFHFATAPSTHTSEVILAIAKPQEKGIQQWLPKNSDKVRLAILTAVLTALGTLFVVYFQRVVGLAQRVLVWAWNRVTVEQAVEARYRKSLARDLRTVQILAMSEPKDLETFYIPLKLVNWESPELKGTGRLEGEETLSFYEALEQHGRITIVGAPGSGKTTMTSHAAAALAEGRQQLNGKKLFPVYVQLRDLRQLLEDEEQSSKTLKDFIEEVLERYGFANAHIVLERKLENGNCLVVLDGFDELADKEGKLQNRLARKVTDFAKAVSEENRIVLTSRAAGYEPAWFSGFSVLEMTDLALPQAKEFITRWYAKSHEQHAHSLHEVLDASERLQMLVANPLMLAIVCYVFGTKSPEEHFLPQRRVDLYERCTRALIRDWDWTRDIDREPSFNHQDVQKVLEQVAYEALIAEKHEFLKRELLALIRTHMPGEDLPQYKDEIFLREVLEHTGLFREKGYGLVGFIHLTFQEYLAAHVIEERVLHGVESGDVRAEMGPVIANIANPVWAEPIKLTAGKLRGRPEFVTVLHEEYKKRPTPEVEHLLAGCLRDADLSDPSPGTEFLAIQDEILSALVDTALMQEAT